MSEKAATTSGQDAYTSELLETPVGIRAPWNVYLSAFFIGTYLCAFLFYAGYGTAGFVAFALAWVVIPFLALSDNIVFDGRRLYRTGLLPTLWAWSQGRRRKLKTLDIEQVDTQALRLVRRSGRIIYRYRTAVHGRGVSFVFTSSGENYRELVSSLLPRLAAEVLDARSLDLREHLIDPKEAQMKASFAGIPRSDVLRSSVKIRSRQKPLAEGELDIGEGEGDKAKYLQRLGNELRLAGYLTQAMESFRRALLLRPRDASLLLDFARCLQSFAGVERDRKLGLRSIAALRLAERYASEDASLLSRIGESYVQAGEWSRAVGAFQKAIDRFGDSFLAARGLAEAALRDGKIAHVIHQFMTAHRAAGTPSLRRWTLAEADYFSNLNSDGEYMEMEVSRVSLIESLARAQRTLLRIASFGIMPLGLGILVDDSIMTDVGWAISLIALAGWIATAIGGRMFARRIPYELVEAED